MKKHVFLGVLFVCAIWIAGLQLGRTRRAGEDTADQAGATNESVSVHSDISEPVCLSERQLGNVNVASGESEKGQAEEEGSTLKTESVTVSQDVIVLRTEEVTASSTGDMDVAKLFPTAKTAKRVRLPSMSTILGGLEHDVARLVFALPDGELLEVDVLQHEARSDKRGVFVGRVRDVPLSEVILSYCGAAMTASMVAPGIGHFEIAYAGEGDHLLMEIDSNKILPNAQPLLPVYE